MPNPGFDLSTSFIIIFIEASKVRRLILRTVGKKIAFIQLDEFFDYLGCVNEDLIQQLFEIKDQIDRVQGGICIQTKDKYAKFIGRLSRSEMKKKVFLRLANVEEDKEE